jgi:regulator of replication initiation timing/DNA-binding MarR family transcriptional regulator
MFWEEKKVVEKSFEQKDTVKEAFAKVKNDIFTLGNEIYSVKTELSEIKNYISAIVESVDKLKLEIIELKDTPRYPTHIPTHDSKSSAYPTIPSNTPTVPVETRGLKYPDFDISSGNRGVPTDRQTNQQTDNYREISVGGADFDTQTIGSIKPLKNQIQEAEDILNSLDNLKKEIRLKFKTITNQEMLVFSTIYQLESEFPEGLEYKQIATKLKLSESSIRDYVQKLISKGIPVDKIKLNNKKILLKISLKLKNIAPLETLIKLREI